jgi:FlaA1/EpsC-like NDP-sugar epimerase
VIKKINNRHTVIIHDLLMSAFAWQIAWWARFNFDFPFPEWKVSLITLPYVVIVQAIIFWRMNLYRGIWRFASLPDLSNISRASMLGGVCITLILFILFRLDGVPRSVLILYPVFLTFLLGGPRLGYRLWKDKTFNLKAITNEHRALIIGAGRAGEMLARDMLRSGSYLPVGFIDNNPALSNSEIHGIRVLGTIERLSEIVGKYAPSIIVIAIPSATNEQMQRIVGFCEETTIPVRTLPKLTDMASGTPSLDKLRDLSIEDLLGREKVELDWKVIQDGLINKIVFVSGGGGSIGAELCQQIAELGPKSLIIFERSEFNLYKIQQQLALSYPSLNIRGILGDICDGDKLEHTLKLYRPNVVFHAAAYKHVPILQNQVREAVNNNIFGTVKLANAADKYQCEKFILISTDKAVNPVNVLGLTKRVAEMFCEYMNKGSDCCYVTVRFGNVLGSDGSVVPLFQDQIKRGGPVTVTHPQVKRFFMTIRESCQLILQASTMAKGGEIFVLDMGEPVKISYLAEQLIRLSGVIPGKDIKIEYTGLRPGEKLNEELFHDDERQEGTSNEKILLARHPEINIKHLIQSLEELTHASKVFDEEKLIGILEKIMPGDLSDNVVPLNREIL